MHPNMIGKVLLLIVRLSVGGRGAPKKIPKRLDRGEIRCWLEVPTVVRG